MNSYRTIQEGPEARLMAGNSLFIAWGREAKTLEDMRQLKEEARGRYPDATHHCLGGVLGGQILGDDDGEPSGTAGAPICNALRSQGLENCAVVVVRYFGGRKLGIRGLLEAYGQAARSFLSKSVLRERRQGLVFAVDCDYPLGEELCNPKAHPGLLLLSKEYGAVMSLRFFLPLEEEGRYRSLLAARGARITEEGRGFY